VKPLIRVAPGVPSIGPILSVLSALAVLSAPAVSCARSTSPTPRLAIAAASDLRYALDEIVEAFEADHRAAVTVSYGSSGTFYAQLQHGAPFDLFLSADIAYPRELARRGLTVPGSEFSYANGRIVVWVPAASPVAVEALGLQALVQPGVERVAIANPQHAPYGRAAEAALRTAGLLDAVKPKLVLGENISQTLQFVHSGGADAGVVALSLVLAPPVVQAGRYWLVPAEWHPPIEQSGTIMRSVADIGTARAFRAFMVGDAARAILERYGFVLPRRPGGPVSWNWHGASRDSPRARQQA
jgi:molybdate transport system substrate-binding protein